MLARCTRCRSTFFTDEYGLQRCPHCNAQVLISDPDAKQEETAPAHDARRPGNAEETRPGPENSEAGHDEDTRSDDRLGDTPTEIHPHGGSDEPRSTQPTEPAIPAWYRTGPSGDSEEPNEPTPWEQQDEIGFVRAFFDTVGRVLGNPERIFGRMQWGTAPSAHTFYLLVAVMPAVLGRIIAMQLEDPAATMKALEDAIQTVPEANRDAARQFAELFAMSDGPGLIGTIIGLPLMYFAALYIGAGVAHLFLLLLGEVRSGWTGTFKAFVYGSTPLLFAIIPVCGSTVAQFWTMGLCVYGLMKAHRTNLGYALIGVVGLPLLLCCCGGIGAVMLAMQFAGGGSP